MLAMHPKTAQALRGQLVKTEIDGKPAAFVVGDFRYQITESALLPERRWNERWVPPKGDRFFELDASDESWARPLGLGTVETVDLGPYVLHLSEKLNDHFLRQIAPEMNESVGCTTTSPSMQCLMRELQMAIRTGPIMNAF